MRLSRSVLKDLPTLVCRPAYDPAEVRPAIVHLGLGNFHRAHMARYMHALMEVDEGARAWGIIGAGLRPQDRSMAEALQPQDGLYTLVERDAGFENASVIASLSEVIFAGDSSAALLERATRPSTRIISLTVTENGYHLNRATKRLNLEDPLIAADLRREGSPRTAIGLIVEAMACRRAAAIQACTVLSCDNIQENGAVVKDAVLDFARARDPSLADWIAEQAHFPSTMVDRITPGTRPEDMEMLAERFGLEDAWPVFCEPFTQWIVEDSFSAGRPAWEKVGVQFVPDVRPYEAMKLRLLNASHLAVAGIGRLIGYTYVDEALRDERLARYMAALMDRETGPTLPQIPGIDLTMYKRTLIKRFLNPTVKDTLERINSDASLNMLLDPLRGRLRDGGTIDLLAFGVAAWMRRVAGVDETGRPIKIHHPLAAVLQEHAKIGRGDPRPMLTLRELFGDLGENERLVAALQRWLTILYAEGASIALSTAASELAF